jgi:hypothetical protein
MDKGLLISIRNVGLKAKNSKARFQERLSKNPIFGFSRQTHLIYFLIVHKFIY